MSRDCATSAPSVQESAQLAVTLQERLHTFVAPLLHSLDHHLDVRLVRTFLATLFAIVEWRNRAHGLLLSELGGYLSTPDHAPVATKRLSNLLRSKAWAADLIAQFLWSLACSHVQTLLACAQQPLVIWDESVLEKSESSKSEGLCAVRSSKARRLTRIRPDFFNPPPTRPICVAGLHWLCVLIVGDHTPPVLAAMRWWTTRGERAEQARTLTTELLRKCSEAWGRSVLHVFDRGYASGPWVETFVQANIRFVVRWKKGNKLLDSWGKAAKPGRWRVASVRRVTATCATRELANGERWGL